MEPLNGCSRSVLINIDSIISVLRSSTRCQYNARELDTNNANIELNVIHLFEQDFDCQFIANTAGELSLYYPRRIILPVVNRSSTDSKSILHSNFDIRDAIIRSRIARCRSRFVVPAILIDRKYICRSSTIAAWGEVYPRSTADRFAEQYSRPTYSNVTDSNDGSIDFEGSNVNQNSNNSTTMQNVDAPQQKNIFDRFRGADIELLKSLDVGSIANLMVEKRKSKFGVNITSSENSDKENRYRDFQLLILPYPGCEHFRDFSMNSYNGEKMFYDWAMPLNDVSLDVPPELMLMVSTNWNLWRSWNSVELTKNYFQLLIRHLETNDKGLLVHCISGWDRTPMFISLLRLSLWADGWIHQTLTVEEITYLTLAYDWYLFGHCLPDRLSRGEEIMFFSFMMLPYLAGSEFSYKNKKNLSISHLITSTFNPDSLYLIGSVNPLNQSNASSAIDINEDNSVEDLQNSLGDYSFASLPEIHNEELITNEISKPKTDRAAKLFAVSELFKTCYRTVIPNQTSMSLMNETNFAQSFASFIPQSAVRGIARSINNMFTSWKTTA